jgi:hypothetical protein
MASPLLEHMAESSQTIPGTELVLSRCALIWFALASVGRGVLVAVVFPVGEGVVDHHGPVYGMPGLAHLSIDVTPTIVAGVGPVLFGGAWRIVTIPSLSHSTLRPHIIEKRALFC